MSTSSDEAAAADSLLTDGDSSKNLAMHQSLIDALVTQMKDFLMEHKEFDSYAGLQRLTKDPDYLASVANVTKFV